MEGEVIDSFCFAPSPYMEHRKAISLPRNLITMWLQEY